MKFTWSLSLVLLIGVPADAQTFLGLIEGTVAGDTVRIEYELDASTPDGMPGDPNIGVYLLDPLTLEIGGVAKSFTVRGLNVFVSSDIISVGIIADGLCSDGSANVGVVLQGAGAVTSDAIPPPFTDAGFSVRGIFIKESGTCNQVNGTLTSWVHSLSDPNIPATSHWTLLVLALLITVAGTLLHARRTRLS